MIGRLLLSFILFLPYGALADAPGVTIGVLTDINGPYSGLNGMGSVEAARMAVEDFGGTVLGHPIQVLFGDHQNNPDTAIAIMSRWIDTQNVDVVVDLPGAPTALAAQNLGRLKNKITLTVSGAPTDLTGKACSPTGVAWAYDTYSFVKGAVDGVSGNAKHKWFFIVVDNTTGVSSAAQASQFVEAKGGTVLGVARHPLGESDFASYLLQAQSSGADMIGVADAGADMINLFKQAREFGIGPNGQKLVALGLFINQIDALGLEAGQGLVALDGFYWDRDNASRAWSKKFEARRHTKPTMPQAGVYSAVENYLLAVQASGTKDTATVMAKMKATPIHDFFAPNGYIRPDGRMIHDMYLIQVKSPSDSHYSWDYYNILKVLPGDSVFRPMSEGGCPYLSKPPG